MALEIRTLARADIPAMAAIYGEAVRTLTATFETEPPDVAEMTRRFEAREAGGDPRGAGGLGRGGVGHPGGRPHPPPPGPPVPRGGSVFPPPAAPAPGRGPGPPAGAGGGAGGA